MDNCHSVSYDPSDRFYCDQRSNSDFNPSHVGKGVQRMTIDGKMIGRNEIPYETEKMGGVLYGVFSRTDHAQ